MMKMLFGTWRRRLLTLLACALSFAAGLVAALSVGLIRSPKSLDSVRAVPVFGPAAVAVAEWRVGPLTPAAVENKDVPTYREVAPLSASEIADLIEGLKKQREVYLNRLAAVQDEEKRMTLVRADLKEEREQLQALKAEIEKKWETVKKAADAFNQQVTDLNAVEAKNLKQLASTYEAMKPESAAQIVAKLDEPTAVKTLYLMKERSAAKVLENMDKDAAARLTERLTRIRQTN